MPILHTQRKLQRIPDRGRIAGICAGFAYWLGVELWFMRAMWILLLFVNGVGLFAYILFWLVMPRLEVEPPDFDTVTDG